MCRILIFDVFIFKGLKKCTAGLLSSFSLSEASVRSTCVQSACSHCKIYFSLYKGCQWDTIRAKVAFYLYFFSFLSLNQYFKYKNGHNSRWLYSNLLMDILQAFVKKQTKHFFSTIIFQVGNWQFLFVSEITESLHYRVSLLRNNSMRL